MSSNNLAGRIETSLRRQIDAFTEMSHELGDISSQLSEEEIEAFADHQGRQFRRTQELVREYQALLRESDGGNGLGDDERTRLRELAAEVETLTQGLRARYEEAYRHVQEAMHSQRDLSATIRRGRDMLTRYRPHVDGNSDHLDRSV
jgi:N-glycosylase/DNA lyase